MVVLLLLALVPMTMALVIADSVTNKDKSALGRIASGATLLGGEVARSAEATLGKTIGNMEAQAKASFGALRLLAMLLRLLRNLLHLINR